MSKDLSKEQFENWFGSDHLEVYNHGVSDGLLGGNNPYFQEDQYVSPLRQFYREGFQFGVSLWLKQREMKEDEK